MPNSFMPGPMKAWLSKFSPEVESASLKRRVFSPCQSLVVFLLLSLLCGVRWIAQLRAISPPNARGFKLNFVDEIDSIVEN
jgi:hypothetical protein